MWGKTYKVCEKICRNIFHKPRRHLLLQSKHWKYQNNVRNMFKVSNKGPRRRSNVFNCYLGPGFSHFSGVSIVYFEQKNASWVMVKNISTIMSTIKTFKNKVHMKVIQVPIGVGLEYLLLIWTYFTPYSSVFIVNFEHVIAGWVALNFCRKKLHHRLLTGSTIYSFNQ